MDLHRTTKKPDWQKRKSSEYNIFQRVAARTDGILSPANIVTLIGFGVVLYGLVAILQKQFWLGLILIGIGRLFDIADGFVAQATHTKSPIGELFDAVADKVGTFLTIIVLVVAQVTSWWIIIALVVPQVVISGITLYRRQRGRRMHPSRSGKLSMAAAWGGIVGVIIMKATDEPLWLAIGVYALVAVSFLLGSYAVVQYAKGRD